MAPPRGPGGHPQTTMERSNNGEGGREGRGGERAAIPCGCYGDANQCTLLHRTSWKWGMDKKRVDPLKVCSKQCPFVEQP